ncbi:hypothetical protein BH10CYA1_BH10CYA1_24690 [soil metagenome]
MDPTIYWSITIAVATTALALTVFNAKQWIGGKKFLCEDCKYNNPEDCVKLERPTALDCTAYRAKS